MPKRNLKAVGLTVRDIKFKDFLLNLYLRSRIPQHMASFCYRVVIFSILVKDP